MSAKSKAGDQNPGNKAAKKAAKKTTSNNKAGIASGDTGDNDATPTPGRAESAEANPVTIETSDDKDVGGRAKSGTDPIPTSPHRQKVVDLATQLVSAQIVANSHYEASVGVAIHLRRMMTEIVERLTIKTPDYGHLDPLIAGIAQAMKGFRSPAQSILRPRVLEPMSHTDLDRLFRSAMFRAQQLLKSPEQDERIICAEQLFEPEETLSENGIFERFRDYEWPDLTSRPSVTALMARVDAWFAAHYEALGSDERIHRGSEEIEESDQMLPLDLRIAHVAGELGWLLRKAQNREIDYPHVDHYHSIQESLDAFSHARGRPFLEYSFARLENTDRRNLIFMIYCELYPQQRVPVSGTARKGKKPKSPDRYYRPWALFRYLRRFGNVPDDQEGIALNLDLRAGQNLLKSTQVPNIIGIFPREFAFGPIGDEMEDLLASTEDEYEEDNEDEGDLQSP